MGKNREEKVTKCTSDALEEALAQLTTDQIRWVIARQENPSNKEAAKAIGISVRAVYKWPPIVKETARLMAADGLATAQHVLKRSLAKAALVKAAGLDSGDERIRQAAATEIIDRAMGKAEQKHRVGGEGEGGEVLVRFISNVDDEQI